MNNISISQTEPISSLPKNYNSLVKRAKSKEEPVVFLKRNKPVAALIGWNLLNKYLKLEKEKEEQLALKSIKKSEKEFKEGKAKVLSSLADI